MWSNAKQLSSSSVINPEDQVDYNACASVFAPETIHVQVEKWIHRCFLLHLQEVAAMNAGFMQAPATGQAAHMKNLEPQNFWTGNAGLPHSRDVPRDLHARDVRDSDTTFASHSGDPV